MKCKSCHIKYPDDSKFCNNCGGKVISKRLSFKSIWLEFLSQFFNWDNRLWRTIHHLTTKPELVMGAFISGARKKYMHPFAWLTIGITIIVLLNNLMPFDEMQQELSESMKNAISMDEEAHEFNKKFSLKWNKILIAKFNLLMIASLPILALISFFIYYKQKNNYIDHIVIQSYLLIFTFIITHVISIGLYQGFGINPMSSALFMWILLFVYYNFAFTRFYRYGSKDFIWSILRLFLISLIIAMVYFLFGVLGFLIAIELGYIEI